MFFNPERPVRTHLNHLPHWQQDSALVFLTWRLADSVPAGLMGKWRGERDEWLAVHPKPWDEFTESEYHSRFSAQLEQWMDQGTGGCVLRDPENARCLAECLLHFHGERFKIDSFVVMPNHVHVLMSPMAGHSLEKTVQSWKRVSARRINELTGKAGSLWHKRYWDRLVRSESHFWRIRRYIQRNPEKAGLKENEYLLYLPWNQRKEP
jgi:REP element-mobilizing transposase RayT